MHSFRVVVHFTGLIFLMRSKTHLQKTDTRKLANDPVAAIMAVVSNCVPLMLYNSTSIVPLAVPSLVSKHVK